METNLWSFAVKLPKGDGEKLCAVSGSSVNHEYATSAYLRGCPAAGVTWAVMPGGYSPAQEVDMGRNAAGAVLRLGLASALKLDFGEVPARGTSQRRLRLAVSANVRGPEKYPLLELKRRRAQIRARRVLGLV
jgi:hypothetical protein